ncbi:MAG: hypothetical protein Q8J60_01470, partial [Thiobacillus sp.]|nr:hypothetical protein [Thiobacillus sp.]
QDFHGLIQSEKRDGTGWLIGCLSQDARHVMMGAAGLDVQREQIKKRLFQRLPSWPRLGNALPTIPRSGRKAS